MLAKEATTITGGYGIWKVIPGQVQDSRRTWEHYYPGRVEMRQCLTNSRCRGLGSWVTHLCHCAAERGEWGACNGGRAGGEEGVGGEAWRWRQWWQW